MTSLKEKYKSLLEIVSLWQGLVTKFLCVAFCLEREIFLASDATSLGRDKCCQIYSGLLSPKANFQLVPQPEKVTSVTFSSTFSAAKKSRTLFFAKTFFFKSCTNERTIFQKIQIVHFEIRHVGSNSFVLK